MDTHDMNDDRISPEAELARLADGSLPAEREAELRARVRQSPELAAALAEQERAVAMMRSVDAPAPASLRARVAELTGDADPRPRRGLGGGGGRLPRAIVLPGATAVAVVAAAVIILIGGSRATGPTVPQTAGLALASATLPPPGVDQSSEYHLALTAAGIRFPNWGPTSGFRTTGMRQDRLGGRTVTTVFYARDGTRVGYAIVSGAALAEIRGAETITADNVRFTLAREGTGYLATWVQSGHTCVVASHRLTPHQLVGLVTQT